MITPLILINYSSLNMQTYYIIVFLLIVCGKSAPQAFNLKTVQTIIAFTLDQEHPNAERSNIFTDTV